MSAAPVLTVIPLRGIPEVRAGDDLAELVDRGLATSAVTLTDGDVVVVSSKIASKSLGLVADDPDKDDVIARESEVVVAERAGPGRVTRVVRAKAGPVMAAAGVDGSNTGQRGGWLVLPRDPDAVCERLHLALTARYGVRLGVVLSDTSARPWRLGVSDFALGAHGVRVIDDLRGETDADGRPLVVTARAVGDEIAAAADLVKGKASAVPVAVVRGAGDLLVDGDPRSHPRGRDLVRTGPHDWFGHGRVEAVRAALGVEPGSAASIRVGIPPSEPGGAQLEAVGRAARLALHEVASGTADVGEQSVLLAADTAYELGVLTARLQVGLWSEGLSGHPGPPGADGCSVTVSVAPRPPQ